MVLPKYKLYVILDLLGTSLKSLKKHYILDSEQSEECIDFTMMWFFITFFVCLPF